MPNVPIPQKFKIEKTTPIFNERIILSLLNNQITDAEFKGSAKLILKCRGSLPQNKNIKQ